MWDGKAKFNEKMDRQGARTPAALEQEYNFGRSFSEINGIATDARRIAEETQETVRRIEENGLDIDVVEELNVAAGTITLKSKGLVIESDGFTLSADEGIKAIRGNIGAWDISDKRIFKATNGSMVNIEAPTTADTDFITVALVSGGIPLRIRANGDIYTMGIISSHNADYTKETRIDNGSITANSGSIAGWDIFDDGTFHDLHYFDIYTGRGTGLQPPNSGAWGLAIGYTDENDWATAPFRVNHQGEMFAKGATFRGSTVFYYDDDGYTQLSDGSLYMVSDEANGGLRLDGSNIWLWSGTGMYIGSSGIEGHLYGTWYLGSDAPITSDVNYKHDITDTTEAYSAFFDSLRPVLYKYNDGKSDRYHTGFIAQEVNEALTRAGLTRKDFAGICITKEGTENEMWALRYSEFIALCIKEIQKLKQDVKALRGA